MLPNVRQLDPLRQLMMSRITDFLISIILPETWVDKSHSCLSGGTLPKLGDRGMATQPRLPEVPLPDILPEDHSVALVLAFSAGRSTLVWDSGSGTSLCPHARLRQTQPDVSW